MTCTLHFHVVHAQGIGYFLFYFIMGALGSAQGTNDMFLWVGFGIITMPMLMLKHSGSFNFHSICLVTRLRVHFWTAPLYLLLVIRWTLLSGGRVCVSTMWRIKFYYLTSLSKVWLPFFRDVCQGAWLCSFAMSAYLDQGDTSHQVLMIIRCVLHLISPSILSLYSLFSGCIMRMRDFGYGRVLYLNADALISISEERVGCFLARRSCPRV